MSECRVFRGSWIPLSDTVGNQTWFCPFCGGKVYMLAGTPTYPTCPWCLSDMPEAEDFDTPEELREALRKNESITGKRYSTSREDAEMRREKRKQKYWADPKADNERCKQYRETHKEQVAAYMKDYCQKHRPELNEYKRQWRAKNRDRINAARRADRLANPEKYKKYYEHACGKPMKEIEAHIYGTDQD